jgi:Trypsin-like peptidase domain
MERTMIGKPIAPFAVVLLLSCALAADGQSVGPLLPLAGVKQMPVTVAAPILLANELAKAPLHSLQAARVGALDSLAAMKAWNAARRRPTQNGFTRPLPLPVEVALVRGHVDPVALSGGIVADAGKDSIAWATRVHVDEAYRLRLHLLDVHLPPGARLWVWGAGEQPREFGLELRAPAGDLWTPSVEGPDLMLEVHAPSGAAGRFALREVMELFRLGSATPASYGNVSGQVLSLLPLPLSAAPAWENFESLVPKDSTSCLLDAACVPSSSLLTALNHAVAQLQFVVGATGFLCSGGLLNDTKSSGRPYLLTAHHCFSDQPAASSLEAFFQYEDSTCDQAVPPDESTFPKTNGATLLATGASDTSSDFTFVLLSGSVPGNSAFLGWNASTAVLTNGTLLFRVAHPAPTGSPFSQAFSETQFLASSVECTGAARPNHIYSAKVSNAGDTAVGSSGSPVVLSNGQVVGQLLGQCPASPSSDNCDPNSLVIDGAFAHTFPFIVQWLNPSSGGGPCVPSANTLCIDDQPGDKRFQIQATVNTAEGGGVHGPASDIPLSGLGISQGGIFWFFGATNPEMLIKVINGCGLGGHYWIFFAALTNVGFSVTVTDTLTGHFKTYTNPDSTTAAPVQDTSALPCS